MLAARLNSFTHGTSGRRHPAAMTRPLIAPLLLAVLLALPVSAHAQGSLLSGYGGPGGGEQTLLGGTLLPAKHGNGSLRAAAARSASPALPPLTARPGGAANAPGTAAPTPSTATSGGAARNGRSSQSGSRSGGFASHAVPAASPKPAAGDAGGFPLTARDLALLALIATVLPLTAVVARRLAGDGSPDVAT
jgi:hypothetical protein